MSRITYERTDIQTAIANAQECAGKLRVTFKSDAIEDLVYLLAMTQRGDIVMKPMDYAVMIAVYQSQDWEKDCNRTVVVELTPKFNEDMFVSRMARALENIEVIPDPKTKKPNNKRVFCRTCNGQMRPHSDVNRCVCDIEQVIIDLMDFGYVEVKTQKKGALRKMKSPDGTIIREEFFGKELEIVLES